MLDNRNMTGHETNLRSLSVPGKQLSPDNLVAAVAWALERIDCAEKEREEMRQRAKDAIAGMKRELTAGFEYAHKLEVVIRAHRDSWLRGDDKCWQDNEELYKLLPEGYKSPERDTTVELDNCRKYIASCHDPKIEYVSPQRRIEELEAENKVLEEKVHQLEYAAIWGERPIG